MKGVQFKAYDLIRRAVEEGIAYGWQRAHKHTDDPAEESIRTEIDNAVISALLEILTFDDLGQ